MKKHIILILTCIILIPIKLPAQVDEVYMINKYWYYRERLKYFVDEGADGSLRGEGMVAGIRNKQSSNVISYGDQMVHFGYYLGMLATEYALLTYYGQDATATLEELNIALNCYIRDDKCENRQPWFQSLSSYDGFHMRQDVPVTFIQDHPELNADLTPSDVVSAQDPGSPAWIEHVSANDYVNWDVNPGGTPYQYYQTNEEMKGGAMSQDNAIGLIKGLALVHKCIPEGYFAHDKAQEIANKVITKMWGAGSWVILDPNNNPVPRGSDAFFYSLPLTVVNMAMGNPMLPSGPNAGNANVAWQTMQLFGTGAENDCMTLTLASLCDCWNGSLSGLPGLNTTGPCIYNLSEQQNWDTFYLLLWEFLHDKTSSNLDMAKVTTQLLSAPCNGPYCYDSLTHNHAPNGWASTYKFEQSPAYQTHGKTGSQGNYNGLDYMLLYNLYHLISIRDGLMPYPFTNASDRNIKWFVPTCHYRSGFFGNIKWGDNDHHAIYEAFNTISSTQIIDTILHSDIPFPHTDMDCPDVGSFDAGYATYRAGKTIVLKPGFHARKGVYFHAYINPFGCSDLKSAENVDAYGFHNPEGAYASNEPQNGPSGNPWNAEQMFQEYLNSTDTASYHPENDAFKLTAYPNPFTEEITLRFTPIASGTAIIRIFNINSVEVYYSEVNVEKNTAVTVNIYGNHLAPGTYCCVLVSEGQSSKINLVKQ